MTAMDILIVDDEQLQREMLAGFLAKQDYGVMTAASGSEALELFDQHPFDLVLLDHRMEDMNGDEVLARIRERDPLARVIMITAFGAVDTAVRVMQLGAEDFLEKPVDLERLLARIREIEEQVLIHRETAPLEQPLELNDLPVRIIGRSRPMREALSILVRAAATPWPVLIRGETGTGKELAARLVHLLSNRKNGPFIELNCAAVPENLFESELFGHEKGAFTGAANRRRGVFEQAHGGTLLLDEIGELPLPLQAKLLRVIQEGRLTRVGGERSLEVDTRLVAATNRDIRKMIDQGRFREDLYFRLNVIEVELPPLRRRRDDIPLLIDFFLDRFGTSHRFDQQALHLLARYDYPGNVRELEHIIQRSLTLARATVIGPDGLPPEISRAAGPDRGGNLGERLERLEHQLIVEALEDNHWVQTRAARKLGISERVLRYKMEKLGISRKKRTTDGE